MWNSMAAIRCFTSEEAHNKWTLNPGVSPTYCCSLTNAISARLANIWFGPPTLLLMHVCECLLAPATCLRVLRHEVRRSSGNTTAALWRPKQQSSHYHEALMAKAEFCHEVRRSSGNTTAALWRPKRQSSHYHGALMAKVEFCHEVRRSSGNTTAVLWRPKR